MIIYAVLITRLHWLTRIRKHLASQGGNSGALYTVSDLQREAEIELLDLACSEGLR